MLYIKSSKRIKELRIQRGYSVSQLAEDANISTKFMYRIEEGKAGFSARVLLNIANALNVSCDYILKGSENNEDTILNETLKQFDKNEQSAIERILLEIVRIKVK